MRADVVVSAAWLIGDKSVNDRYRQAAGDRVLQVFADELTARCRPGNTAARLDGEEFALVLTEIMPRRAELAAELIRKAFEARRFFNLPGADFPQRHPDWCLGPKRRSAVPVQVLA
ncbi:diguanylate cyclase [Rhizobium sp. WYCCWR 11317]|uniref:Diguanylate cyclase n=1 Tax=Rhizobium changzhiense TaxID=2692317 RepID=A0ABR6AF14_9HYPH|nr:diguanylate cyclase [Rhizobium changzhiense]